MPHGVPSERIFFAEKRIKKGVWGIPQQATFVKNYDKYFFAKVSKWLSTCVACYSIKMLRF